MRFRGLGVLGFRSLKFRSAGLAGLTGCVRLLDAEFLGQSVFGVERLGA